MEDRENEDISDIGPIWCRFIVKIECNMKREANRRCGRYGRKERYEQFEAGEVWSKCTLQSKITAENDVFQKGELWIV